MTHVLETELSLSDLGEMLPHLWFAGSRHPATQLHLQVAMSRGIVVADRMDRHLLWSNDRRLFLKPIPRFLRDPDFWRSNLQCPHDGPWFLLLFWLEVEGRKAWAF